jgi:hypothetical protein
MKISRSSVFERVPSGRYSRLRAGKKKKFEDKSFGGGTD